MHRRPGLHARGSGRERTYPDDAIDRSLDGWAHHGEPELMRQPLRPPALHASCQNVFCTPDMASISVLSTPYRSGKKYTMHSV